MKKLKKILLMMLVLCFALTVVFVSGLQENVYAKPPTPKSIGNNDPKWMTKNETRLKIGGIAHPTYSKSNAVTVKTKGEWTGFALDLSKKDSDGNIENPLTLTFTDCGNIMGVKTKTVMKITKVHFGKRHNSTGDKYKHNPIFLYYNTKSNVIWLGATQETWEGHAYGGVMNVTYQVRVYPENRNPATGLGTGTYSSTPIDLPLAQEFIDIDQKNTFKKDNKKDEVTVTETTYLSDSIWNEYYKWNDFDLKTQRNDNNTCTYFQPKNDISYEYPENYTKAGIIGIAYANKPAAATMQVGGNMATSVTLYSVYNSGTFYFQKQNSIDDFLSGESNEYNFKGITYGIYNASTGKKVYADLYLNEKGFAVDANGKKLAIELPAGQYYAQEIKTNEWYEYSSAKTNFTVNKNDYAQTRAVVTASDPPSTGTVTFSKSILGENPPKDLSTLEFNLKSLANSNREYSVTLGKSYNCGSNVESDFSANNFQFTKVPFGDYELTENLDSIGGFSEGSFDTDAASKRITVHVASSGTTFKYNGQTVSSFENEWKDMPYFQLKITKELLGGNDSLSGFKYKLYSDASCQTQVGTNGTTDSNGIAYITDIPNAGEYYLVETDNKEIWDPVYDTGKNYKKITIGRTGEAKYDTTNKRYYYETSTTFQNLRKNPTLVVTKYLYNADGSVANPSGWEFTLYDSDNREIAKRTTNNDGKAIFQGKDTKNPNGLELPAGTYTIVESNFDSENFTSTGWEMSPRYHKPATTVQITENDISTINVKKITNYREGSKFTFRVTKQPEQTVPANTNKYNLNGIQYGIYTDSACENFAQTPDKQPAIITLSGYSGSSQTATGTQTIQFQHNLSTHTVYIKEIASSVQGKGFEADNTVYTVQGILGETVDVTPTPIQEPVEKGTLKFTKEIVVEDSSLANDIPDPSSLTFTLKNSYNTYTRSPQKNTSTGEWEVTFDDVFIGEYTLTETGLDSYNSEGSMTDITGPLNVEIKKGNNKISLSNVWKNEWEENKTFKIAMKKTSSEPLAEGMDSYNLNGIKYKVYLDANGNREIGTLTLSNYDPSTTSATSNVVEYTAPGTSNTMKMYVKEVASSTEGTGFETDTAMHEVTAINGTVVWVGDKEINGNLFQTTDVPKRADLTFKKVVSYGGASVSEPNLSLLEFVLTSKDDPDMEPYKASPVKKNGEWVITFNNILLGEYTLEETGVENFDGMQDETGPVIDVTIHEGTNKINNSNEWVNFFDPPPPPPGKYRLEINKTSTKNVSSPKYDMNGIVYKVYSDSGCTNLLGNVVLSGSGNGGFGSIELEDTSNPDVMTVYVKEDASSVSGKGFNVDNQVHRVDIPKGSTGEVGSLSVQDSPKNGTLRFTKVIECDDQNAQVPDARHLSFTLTNLNNPNLTYTSTVDTSNGEVYFPSVELGTYSISESGCEQYDTYGRNGGKMEDITGTQIGAITIQEGNNTLGTPNNQWRNKWIPKIIPPGVYMLTVQKTSTFEIKSNAYSMNGIKYGVYAAKNGNDVDTSSHIGDVELSGNANSARGSITITQEEGPDSITVYVKEKSVPNGSNFKMDDTIYEITIPNNGHKTLDNIQDEPKVANLSFKKVITNASNSTPSPTKLEFTLENTVDPSITYTKKVDSEGNVNFTNLEIGTYYISESGINDYSSDKGHFKDITGQSLTRITLNEGNNTINSANEWKNEWVPDPTPFTFKINMTKKPSRSTNTPSYSLDGIKYSVYTEKNGNDVKESSKVSEITLRGDNVDAVGMTTFVLYDVQDTMTFYLKETTLPNDSNFNQNNEIYEVTGIKDQMVTVNSVVGGETVDYVVDDPKSGDLEFEKILTCNDPKATVPEDLSELEFVLRNRDEPSVVYRANPEKKNNKWMVSFEDILLGEYQLSEEGLNEYNQDGYMYPSTGNISVSISTGNNSINNANKYENEWIPDPPPGGIEIIKETDNFVEDKSVFRVTVKDKVTDEVVAQNVRFSQNGVCKVEGLYPGTYTVHENLSAEQLNLYKQPDDFDVVVEENATTLKRVTLNNVTRKTTLTVTKKSSDGNVEGIDFKLSGTTIDGQVVSNITLPTERTTIGGEVVGVVTFENLLPGNYVIQEVGFPDTGYLSTDWINGYEYPAKRFTCDGETPGNLTFTNTPISFHLKKKELLEDGSQGTDPVDDAIYRVYHIEGNINSENDLSACRYKEFSTDVNGEINTTEIEGGKCWIYETYTPEGYVVEDTPPPIDGVTSSRIGKFVAEVTFDSEHTDITVNDTNRREYGTIWIEKADEDGNPVAGAEFTLFTNQACTDVAKNKDNIPMVHASDSYGSFTVHEGDDDYHSFYTGLAWGTYYLKETKAPRGYEIDDTVYVCNINEHTTFLEVKTDGEDYILNNHEKGKVELTKKDKETKEPLDGAVFNLYNNKDELVAEGLVTGQDNNHDGTPDGTGKIRVDNLSWDIYYFKEVQAPTGYTINTEPARFPINGYATGDLIVPVVCEDTAAPAQITATVKIKAAEYWKEHGNPTFFAVLEDENGNIDTQALTFDEAIIEKAISESNVYVSQTVTFPVAASPAKYHLYTIPADRYELDESYPGERGIDPLQTGPVTNFSYVTDFDETHGKTELSVPAAKTGTTTFVYKKSDWSDYGDQTNLTNIVKKTKTMIGLSVTYTGASNKVDANQLFDPNTLDVYALFDDGTAKKLDPSEYHVSMLGDSSEVLWDGGYAGRYPDVTGPYSYVVSYTRNGMTVTGTYSVNVNPPQKIKVYFHSGGNYHINSPDGEGECSICDEDADYIEMYKNRPLGQGIPSQKYNISRPGYSLVWVKTEGDLNDPLDPLEEITQDTHYYAVWAEAIYSVSYITTTPNQNLLVLDTPNTQYKVHNQSVALSTKEPHTRYRSQDGYGYDFLGWSTMPNKKTAADVEYRPSTGLNPNYSANADMILYAVWKPHTGTLSTYANDTEFDKKLPAAGVTNQTTRLISSTDVEFGSTVLVPTAPFRTGYRFEEWNTKQDGTGKSWSPGDVLFQMDDEPEDVSLYAQWTQLHLGADNLKTSTDTPELSWADIDEIGDKGIASQFFATDFSTIKNDLGNDGVLTEANRLAYTKKTTINGAEVHAMIADFDHDKTADGGTAAITFITYESVGSTLMEATGKVATGWDQSTMRNSTLATIANGLDSDLRTNIVNISKDSINEAGNKITTTDKLFIPSVEELYGIYAYPTKP